MLDGLDAQKRLLVYLVINVIVSALTTLFVLVLWTRFSLSSAPTLLNGTPAVQAGTRGQLQISAVIGAGDLDNENVVMEHIGDQDVSLAGWSLRDEDGNEYDFPALVLHPGGEVTVFTRQGDDSASQLFWDRRTPVWQSGELVMLFDPSNQQQAGYTVP